MITYRHCRNSRMVTFLFEILFLEASNLKCWYAVSRNPGTVTLWPTTAACWKLFSWKGIC